MADIKIKLTKSLIGRKTRMPQPTLSVFAKSAT